MAKLVALRLALAVPQLLGIMVVTFFLTYLVPGSPAAALLTFSANDESIAAAEAELGLDRPVAERLGEFLSGAVRGDFGESYLSKRPVTSVLADRLPATLSVVFCAAAVAVLVGCTLGMIAGTRLDRTADRAVMTLTSVMVAMPQFLLGLLLLLLFAVKLRWIPVVAYVPITDNPLLWLKGILLPSVSLGFAASGLIARQMRAGVAAAVNSNYASSLASVGVSRRRFYFAYAAKNAMVPVLAATGLTFAILVGASFAVERVFSIPGIGSVLLHAVTSKDFPVVQGTVVMIGTIVIGLNILIDLGYGIVNPRTRPQ